SRSDVAERVAIAVRRVAASDDAGVWTWDPNCEDLRLEGVATDDPDHQKRLGTALNSSDVNGLAELVRNPTPSMLRAGDVTPLAAQLMTNNRLSCCAIAPIAARGTFLGVVVAGFRDAWGNETVADER